MAAPLSRTLGLLLALVSLAGCERPSDPMMSKEAIATRAALPEHVFQGELGGESVFLLLHDCEVYGVYRVYSPALGEIRWESVLAPDFHPIWTACQRQSMSFEAGALTVALGRMAFGAGGCCATEGNAASRRSCPEVLAQAYARLVRYRSACRNCRGAAVCLGIGQIHQVAKAAHGGWRRKTAGSSRRRRCMCRDLASPWLSAALDHSRRRYIYNSKTGLSSKEATCRT